MLTPRSILLHCLLDHPEGASFALWWSAEDDALHWPLLSTGPPLKTGWDVPSLSLEPQPPWSPISLHDLPHPHTLKLWGLFNPKCEGEVPHLLPRGHGVLGKPGLHSIPHMWRAAAVLKASVTSGPGPPSPHDTRAIGTLSSGRNTPSLDPKAHLGSRAGQERLRAFPSHQKGTSRVVSADSQGTAENCLQRGEWLWSGRRRRTCSCSLEPPAFCKLMTVFPLII